MRKSSKGSPLARRGSLLFLPRSLAVAFLLLAIIASPTGASADSQADFIIPDGHFYTQANGYPPQTSFRGYAITDQDGIPFWSEFKRLGGAGTIGFPSSQRLTFEGKVIQLTQRAVLSYHSSTPDGSEGRVRLLDVFDVLSRHGRDGWLEDKMGIPPRTSPVEGAAAPGVTSASSLQLLDHSPAIKQHYEANGDVSALLGLPTSLLHQFADYSVMRFQNGALQLWKVDTPWARAGDMTVVNAGDVLKESGLLPVEQLAPQEPPETVTRRATASSRGQAGRSGLATWYGAEFHGDYMANGEPFDMYDPAITASNLFPLGTRLLVSSARNGRSVEVMVKDTGAFYYPVIVDMSWAAFRKLADTALGTVDVIVEPIDHE